MDETVSQWIAHGRWGAHRTEQSSMDVCVGDSNFVRFCIVHCASTEYNENFGQWPLAVANPLCFYLVYLVPGSPAGTFVSTQTAGAGPFFFFVFFICWFFLNCSVAFDIVIVMHQHYYSLHSLLTSLNHHPNEH